MATRENIVTSEMATTRNLYRKAHRSSKTNCGARCQTIVRLAKQRPVLHMLLFFLLITVSVVIILIVVLTTRPGREKHILEPNGSNYDDTSLFQIPTEILNISIETKEESPEQFDDTSYDESSIRHDILDLDDDLYNSTNIDYPIYVNSSEDGIKSWSDNDLNFTVSDESEIYFWDISPSLSSVDFTLESTFNRDKTNETIISFYEGPKLSIETDSFKYTHTVKETTTSVKPSQILSQATTQLSALLTLRKNVLPTATNPVVNLTVYSKSDFPFSNAINSTVALQQHPETIYSSIPNDINSSLMSQAISSSIDYLAGEQNFWSSLVNLSFSNFSNILFSRIDLISDNPTSQLNLNSTPSTYDTQIANDKVQLGEVIQNDTDEIRNKFGKDVTPSLISSQVEYNHWPETSLINKLTETISTSPLIQGTKSIETMPSEVEFFSSSDIDITTSEKPIFSTSSVITTNESLFSQWTFGGGTSHQEISECRNRTLSFCDDVSSYNSTYLPNLAGASTEFEKWQLISYYNSVVDWGCNLWLKEYLCYILEPMCIDEVAVPPCNSLCRAAKKGCEKYITGSPSLEAVFRCDVFPSATAQVLCAGLGNSKVCKSNEYRCSDTTCIPGSWWCDGVMDCEQGDDEKSCHPRNRNP